MTIFAAPGATAEAALQWPVTGLVGTLGVRIIDTPSGSTFLARTTAGIVENPAGSGLYEWSGTGPSTSGTWSLIWDDGALTPGHCAVEELVVTSTALAAAAPGGTDLCTVADVYLAMETATQPIDTLTQTLITAASRIIQARYQREFAPVAGTPTRRFPVFGTHVPLVPRDVLTALTVTLNPESSPVVLVAGTDYVLKPLSSRSLLGTQNRIQLSPDLSFSSAMARTFGFAQLDITGTWGAAAVPDDVRRGAALTVASWLSARISDSSSNLLGDLAQSGRDVRPERFGGFSIPFDAHTIFHPYAWVSV